MVTPPRYFGYRRTSGDLLLASVGTRQRVLAAASVTVIMWASAFVAIRSADTHLSPGAVALGRLLIGSAALGALCLVRGSGLPPRAAWSGIISSGVLWFGVYMVALNWGERDVDAGTAAMVVNVGPVLIAVLSGWLLAEGFPSRLLAGVAVSFGGAVVVGLSTRSGGGSSLAGVLLCVLAAVCYSVAVVCQKPALRHASALQVTTFGCMAGTVACLPFAGQLLSGLAHAPASAVIDTVYLGLFPTVLGYTTWAYALARSTAGSMGATTYIVPALVIGMSWALLGQVPGWLAVLGGLLCLAGVAISRGRRRQPAPAQAPATAGTATAALDRIAAAKPREPAP